MKKDIKVKVIFTEGYEERFTKACIRVAEKRVESMGKEIHPAVPDKITKTAV